MASMQKSSIKVLVGDVLGGGRGKVLMGDVPGGGRGKNEDDMDLRAIINKSREERTGKMR